MTIESLVRSILLSDDCELEYSGSCYISESNLKEVCYKNDVDFSKIDDAVSKGTIIKTRGNYTIPEIFEEENIVANNIIRLMYQKKRTYSVPALKALITGIEKEQGIKLDEGQVEAVITGINNNFAVMTGGPGTGKTTTLKVYYLVLKKLRPDSQIGFVAPTGKASKRITESTGYYAQTAHKLFKIISDDSEAREFKGDVLISDESSMFDLKLMAKILPAIESGKKIFLVGDIDQLPSVGYGAILRDILASNVVPVARLTKTFRQEGESGLLDNIKKIKNGDVKLDKRDDFTLLEVEKDVQKQILSLYIKECKEFGIMNTCLLMPKRESGVTSVKAINRLVQTYVNPKGKRAYMETQDGYFQERDIVMQLKNRIECVNGDVGYVEKVTSDTVSVVYDKVHVTYKRKELYQLTLAYAVTVHKSQGSEYKSVITGCLAEHGQMLQKNLFYTAVTRAKVRCNVIYDDESLEKAVTNIDGTKRITFLKEKLQYLDQKVLQEYKIA